jgi:capsule polysaccharide export protein KpsE/RkpR
MVRDFAEIANQVAHRVSASSAAEERRFLETRVAQARADLDIASVKLRDFQEQHKIISLPDQAKAVVAAMASLRAEMLDKQMQLAFVDGFSSSDESTSGGLRRQVGILQSKLKSLEEARALANPAEAAPSQPVKRATPESRSGGIFPQAMDIPILEYQLAQLIREQKLQETLFGLLTQRLEMARVNEARDTSTFQILDSPTLPTRKSRPRRLLVTAEWFFVGAFVGLALAFAKWRKGDGTPK